MGRDSRKESQTYQREPFLLSVDEVLSHLQSSTNSGLGTAQVQQYQQKYGENRLESDGGFPWYKILTKQATNAMILVSEVK